MFNISRRLKALTVPTNAQFYLMYFTNSYFLGGFISFLSLFFSLLCRVLVTVFALVSVEFSYFEG
jgi:hypothetical protein